jgi:hypothetical protein
LVLDAWERDALLPLWRDPMKPSRLGERFLATFGVRLPLVPTDSAPHGDEAQPPAPKASFSP